jgi:hypothetical protein
LLFDVLMNGYPVMLQRYNRALLYARFPTMHADERGSLKATSRSDRPITGISIDDRRRSVAAAHRHLPLGDGRPRIHHLAAPGRVDGCAARLPLSDDVIEHE